MRTFLILLQVWCFKECEPIKRRQRTGNEIQCRFWAFAIYICFTLWTSYNLYSFRSKNESWQSNESKAVKDSQTDNKSTQSSQDNKRIWLVVLRLNVPVNSNKRKQANWNAYPTIYITATEIAGNYLFPWKDANWLTCWIIYMEVIR